MMNHSIKTNHAIATNALTLTQRQQDVIQLISQGYSNKEIAKQLAISPETVKTHLQEMFNKFGIGSRTTLACVFLQATHYGQHTLFPIPFTHPISFKEPS